MSETAPTTPAPVEQTKSVLEMTFIEAAQQRNYVTDTGKILPRKYTGLTAAEQRRFTTLIKQARSNLVAK
jgi:small subunit ribosomal protein S18